ncbi:MAG: hypothetical protein DWQ20_00915 [Actinobacteria bacterium]|nr:MAG: hypothetical protein DWQ20_00915 [Actinomycetota bacterium]
MKTEFGVMIGDGGDYQEHHVGELLNGERLNYSSIACWAVFNHCDVVSFEDDNGDWEIRITLEPTETEQPPVHLYLTRSEARHFIYQLQQTLAAAEAEVERIRKGEGGDAE